MEMVYFPFRSPYPTRRAPGNQWMGDAFSPSLHQVDSLPTHTIRQFLLANRSEAAATHSISQSCAVMLQGNISDIMKLCQPFGAQLPPYGRTASTLRYDDLCSHRINKCHMFQTHDDTLTCSPLQWHIVLTLRQELNIYMINVKLSPNTHSEYPDSIPDQTTYDVWAKWHCDWILLHYFGFPLSVSLHHCSIRTFTLTFRSLTTYIYVVPQR